MATDKDINLSYTWLNGQPGSVGAKDQLSVTLDIVTNYHKRQNTNTTRSSLPKPKPVSYSEGDSSIPSQAEKLSKPADNSF